MSPAPLQVPEISQIAELFPTFEFDRLIHLGRTGAIYKAHQRSLDRAVAIKILYHELGEDPVFRRSFVEKAKAMARLSHPNLIRVFDFGDLDGMLYIVMEFVPGKSLFNSAHGKKIDPKQAVQIALASCRGLAHAHENGIIHRDIKPANILLTQNREPKIGSFGLAHGNQPNANELTEQSSAYLAPEIIDQPENGTSQSDVYAIGAMLRELLTGIPEDASGASAPAIPDLRLAAICRNATHADPAVRYTDASALAAKLEHWLTTGISRPLAIPRTVLQLPKPSLQRPKLNDLPKRAPSPAWGFMKKCATIALLLYAINFLWGAYQTKKETIATLQQIENSKPPVVKVIQLDPAGTKTSSSHETREKLDRALLVSNAE